MFRFLLVELLPLRVVSFFSFIHVGPSADMGDYLNGNKSALLLTFYVLIDAFYFLTRRKRKKEKKGNK